MSKTVTITIPLELDVDVRVHEDGDYDIVGARVDATGIKVDHCHGMTRRGFASVLYIDDAIVGKLARDAAMHEPYDDHELLRSEEREDK